MDFQTIYEVSNESLKTDWVTSIAFVIAGFGISYYNLKFKEPGNPKRMYGIIFGLIFGGGFPIVFINDNASSNSRILSDH